MKKLSQVLVFMFITTCSVLAKEGMWLPILLQLLNENEMKEMGMKITADDIYSVNHSSLKDAVFIFGGGCTGEVVSNKGLIFTNYHCGYGNIQRHSSIDHDYLTDGFWANNFDEELSCPGLTVSFLVEMKDVTERINSVVNDKMSQSERTSAIDKISLEIAKEATDNTHYKAIVESYFIDNQYFLIIYEVFKDVRLVGAPPSNIGKFGGDTDNWEWPRHTGDFSIFRIYADNDNNPAEYSRDNKPYQPKKHFNISLDGVNENDFTMVFGYPGITNEYTSSHSVYNTVEHNNPIIIKTGDIKLEVMKRHSEQSPLIRIQYANKIAGIANGWKKTIGQSLGINNYNGIEMKREYEKRFQQWADNSNYDYSSILPSLEKIYNDYVPYSKSILYINHAGMGIEAVSLSSHFSNLINASKEKPLDTEKIQALCNKVKRTAKSFYKDYNVDIDKEICPQLLKLFYDNIDKEYLPSFFNDMEKKYNGNFESFSQHLFKKSIFCDSTRLFSVLDNYKPSKYKVLEQDPAYIIFASMIDKWNDLYDNASLYNNSIDSLMRLYMKAQMEFEKDKSFYPDANFTLRVAYGKVEGFKPKDAVKYNYFTTLDGIIEKENPDIYDYVVEDKLKDLYNNKDYGRYADQDGTMHVCFIASNHTTGGNSGSPVLNANGELIGLNFDRNWQGTMSDIIYDPNICRNIIVDIRYVLFIIDKYAGATHLINELTINN